MVSYRVKENPIGSAVSEILQYKQTNKQTDIVLLCIIDITLKSFTFLGGRENFCALRAPCGQNSMYNVPSTMFTV